MARAIGFVRAISIPWTMAAPAYREEDRMASFRHPVVWGNGAIGFVRAISHAGRLLQNRPARVGGMLIAKP